MKNLTLKLFSLILLSLSIFSCEKECEEPDSVYDSFSFKFINEAGIDILRAFKEEEKSKIIFTREDGKKVSTYLNTTLNTFSLHIIDTGEKPKGEVNKTFYINFSDLFGSIDDDIDTLNFNYELIYQDNKCVSVWFNEIKVKYNDSLYYTGKQIPFIYYQK